MCRSRTRPPAPTIATSDSSRRRFRQRAVRTGRQWADCDGRQHSTKPSTRSRTANLPIAGHLEEVELDDAVERGQAPRCALLDHPGCEPLVVPPSHRGVRHLMITTRCRPTTIPFRQADQRRPQTRPGRQPRPVTSMRALDARRGGRGVGSDEAVALRSAGASAEDVGDLGGRWYGHRSRHHNR